MTRNFDTRDHQIFPRVEKIEIQYPASGTPSIIYSERNAVLLSNGVNFLDGAANLYGLQINPPSFTDRIQLVNPATGEAINGQTTSLQEVLMGITAVIRFDQLRRDEEQAALAAQVELAMQTPAK